MRVILIVLILTMKTALSLEYSKAYCENLSTIEGHVLKYINLHSMALEKNYRAKSQERNILEELQCISTYTFANVDNYLAIFENVINPNLKIEQEASNESEVMGYHRLILELNEIWFHQNALRRAIRDQEEAEFFGNSAIATGGSVLLILFSRNMISSSALIKAIKSLRQTLIPKTLEFFSTFAPRLGVLSGGAFNGKEQIDDKRDKDSEEVSALSHSASSGESLFKDNGGVWNSPILLTEIADHTVNETLDYENFDHYVTLSATIAGATAAYIVQSSLTKSAWFTHLSKVKYAKFGMLGGVPGFIVSIGAGVLVAKTIEIKGKSNMDAASQFLYFSGVLEEKEASIKKLFLYDNTMPRIDFLDQLFDEVFQYRMAVEDLVEYTVGDFNIKKDELEESLVRKYACEEINRQQGHLTYLEKIMRESHQEDHLILSNQNKMKSKDIASVLSYVGHYKEEDFLQLRFEDINKRVDKFLTKNVDSVINGKKKLDKAILDVELLIRNNHAGALLFHVNALKKYSNELKRMANRFYWHDHYTQKITEAYQELKEFDPARRNQFCSSWF